MLTPKIGCSHLIVSLSLIISVSNDLSLARSQTQRPWALPGALCQSWGTLCGLSSQTNEWACRGPPASDNKENLGEGTALGLVHHDLADRMYVCKKKKKKKIFPGINLSIAFKSGSSPCWAAFAAPLQLRLTGRRDRRRRNGCTSDQQHGWRLHIRFSVDVV